MSGHLHLDAVTVFTSRGSSNGTATCWEWPLPLEQWEMRSASSSGGMSVRISVTVDCTCPWPRHGKCRAARGGPQCFRFLKGEPSFITRRATAGFCLCFMMNDFGWLRWHLCNESLFQRSSWSVGKLNLGEGNGVITDLARCLIKTESTLYSKSDWIQSAGAKRNL